MNTRARWAIRAKATFIGLLAGAMIHVVMRLL
jgi:hypothetical protein